MKKTQNPDIRRHIETFNDEISPRDYFAAAALKGLLADPNASVFEHIVAAKAYALADAMMEERKKL